MSTISMKTLLEAGVHFGHKTSRWDPRMKPYIFMARNGIHIIDLQKTVQMAKKAFEALREAANRGEKILFVGTKKQARSAIEREAKRCGMYYINTRWPGGLLTNWRTVRQSIERLKKLEKMEEENSWHLEARTKKEVLMLKRELEKLKKHLAGIKDMTTIPENIFIVDPDKERIAVQEARKLGLRIFAIVDTNCNPEIIDYPIPGNDDAIRAISLFLETMADAIIQGKEGKIEDSQFSEDDFDASKYDDHQDSLKYKGEYDETGEFVEDEPFGDYDNETTDDYKDYLDQEEN
ncbi:MAG: 30S ribosomal protein S2 [Leptospiraceae bacterium]|nr:MAG: 30S ribosomal protein S2 [Leptospiraceae bacterium]